MMRGHGAGPSRCVGPDTGSVRSRGCAPSGGRDAAALVIPSDPTFANITQERTAVWSDLAPYQPGAFYIRELLAIRTVLSGADRIELLIIDGYVINVVTISHSPSGANRPAKATSTVELSPQVTHAPIENPRGRSSGSFR